MNRAFLIWIVICMTCGITSAVGRAQGVESLDQRVNRGDIDAFLEAANEGRKDLIPALEKYAEYPANPQEGIRVKAKMALAKLGVMKYLDEIVSELTNTTRVAVASGGGTQFHLDYAALSVQIEAFKKLAYIKDRSTVKVIASFLYGKENADDYFVKSNGDSSGYWYSMLIYERPSEAAMKALAQIVDNPPAISLTGTNDTHEASVKIWQQWWEQNKVKYP